MDIRALSAIGGNGSGVKKVNDSCKSKPSAKGGKRVPNKKVKDSKKTLKIKYTRRVKDSLDVIQEIDDLRDFKFWGPAIDIFNDLTQEEADILLQTLEDIYYDGLTDVQLNDIVAYDHEWVYDLVGHNEEDEEFEDEDEELSDSKKTLKVVGKKVKDAEEDEKGQFLMHIWQSDIDGLDTDLHLYYKDGEITAYDNDDDAIASILEDVTSKEEFVDGWEDSEIVNEIKSYYGIDDYDFDVEYERIWQNGTASEIYEFYQDNYLPMSFNDFTNLCERRREEVGRNFGWVIPDDVMIYFYDTTEGDLSFPLQPGSGDFEWAEPMSIVDNIAVNGEYYEIDDFKEDNDLNGLSDEEFEEYCYDNDCNIYGDYVIVRL